MKDPKTFDFSRRSFLKQSMLAGIGGTLGVPLLPSVAESMNNDIPLRLVVMWRPHGTVADQYMPQASGNDVPLSNLTLPFINQPLVPFVDELLIAQGISNKLPSDRVNGHDMSTGSLLTGMPIYIINKNKDKPKDGDVIGTGISVDQVLAQNHHVGSLRVGVALGHSGLYGGNRGTLSYSGPKSMLTTERRPTEMYRRLWSSASSTMPAGDQERHAAMRLQLVDAMKGRYDAIKSKLCNADRCAFEAHWSALRDVELRMQAVSQQSSCTPPNMKTVDPFNYRHYPDNGMLQMDILASALACNLTRVATFMWDKGGSDSVWHRLKDDPAYRSLGDIYTSKAQHEWNHDHDDRARRSSTAIDHWYTRQFAYFLQKLKSIPQGTDGKSLLDYTIVVWLSGLDSGEMHSRDDLPIIIAGGGAKPYFKRNRLVRCGGKAHNHFLVSLCHAMGRTEVAHFGEQDYRGPIAELAA